MAKVAIVPHEQAVAVTPPAGIRGDGTTFAYLVGAEHPIHVHLHRLGEHDVIHVGPRSAHHMLYVWEGAVEAGGRTLPAGSSLLVERGASVTLTSHATCTLLASFASTRPPIGDANTAPRVHLMAADRVPRYREGPEGGVAGGLHADATLPTCPIWLHENKLAPRQSDPEDGIHCHGEDEVILVTGGEMLLGARKCGPGTLLAIAAGTMYGFGIGPQGLSFVNFRPGPPDRIRFKNGMVMDERAYWRERVDPPRYDTLAGVQPETA